MSLMEAFLNHLLQSDQTIFENYRQLLLDDYPDGQVRLIIQSGQKVLDFDEVERLNAIWQQFSFDSIQGKQKRLILDGTKSIRASLSVGFSYGDQKT